MADDTSAQVSPEFNEGGQQVQPTVNIEAITEQIKSKIQSGVEARIGELTAKWREAEARAQAVEHSNAKFLAMLAEREAPAALQIDPEQAAVVRQVVSPEMRQLQERLAAQERMLSDMRFREAATGVPEQFRDKVQETARNLMQQWQAQGKGGWLPEDAVTFAKGLLGVGGNVAPPVNQAQQQLAQFNAGGQMLSGHGAAPQTQRQAGLPAGFDQWSLEKQIAYWESIPDASF